MIDNLSTLVYKGLQSHYTSLDPNFCIYCGMWLRASFFFVSGARRSRAPHRPARRRVHHHVSARVPRGLQPGLQPGGGRQLRPSGLAGDGPQVRRALLLHEEVLFSHSSEWVFSYFERPPLKGACAVDSVQDNLQFKPKSVVPPFKLQEIWGRLW